MSTPPGEMPENGILAADVMGVACAAGPTRKRASAEARIGIPNHDREREPDANHMRISSPGSVDALESLIIPQSEALEQARSYRGDRVSPTRNDRPSAGNPFTSE